MSVSSIETSSQHSGESGSTGSGEVGMYQESLEAVLAWLLQAESLIQEQGEVSDQVQIVKDQFHQHEVW